MGCSADEGLHGGRAAIGEWTTGPFIRIDECCLSRLKSLHHLDRSAAGTQNPREYARKEVGIPQTGCAKLQFGIDPAHSTGRYGQCH